jgi:ankyrin repeat protein
MSRFTLAFDHEARPSKSAASCSASALPKCSGKHFQRNNDRSLEKSLFFHARKGQREELDAVLSSSRRPEIDARDSSKNGATALMLASKYGKAPCVDRLLRDRLPPNINKRDHNGLTALFFACMKGHSACVKRLLQNHPPPNLDVQQHCGFTALMTASEFGHTQCLDQLLSHHRPPHADIQQDDGMTALMLACRNGHDACIDRLLAHQPIPNVNMKQQQGFTALMLACEQGHFSSVDRLLAHHSAQSQSDQLAMEQKETDGPCQRSTPISSAFIDIDAIDCSGATALILVCRCEKSDGKAACIANLLKLRPNLQICDHSGACALSALPRSSAKHRSARAALVLAMHECVKCGLPADGSTAHPKCGRCLSARYCSKTCQQTDWHKHKNHCHPAAKSNLKRQDLTEGAA